jgi:Na+-transporting NADH:ubiquinone oxidoreductase subunit C
VRLEIDNPVYVVLFAAGTALVFTAAIMTLHAATAGVVERNEKLLEQKGLVEIFFGPDAMKGLTDAQIAQLAESRIVRDELTDPDTGRKMGIYLAYSSAAGARERDASQLVGYGFEVTGTGFWARIDGILAVDAGLDSILGIYFLRHTETPGLGGRITEPEFRRQFVGKKITPPAEGAKYVYLGGEAPSGPEDPRFGRHVDAITGATGTSSAVEVFLNADIAAFRRAIAASKYAPATREAAKEGE